MQERLTIKVAREEIAQRTNLNPFFAFKYFLKETYGRSASKFFFYEDEKALYATCDDEKTLISISGIEISFQNLELQSVTLMEQSISYMFSRCMYGRDIRGLTLRAILALSGSVLEGVRLHDFLDTPQEEIMKLPNYGSKCHEAIMVQFDQMGFDIRSAKAFSSFTK